MSELENIEMNAEANTIIESIPNSFGGLIKADIQEKEKILVLVVDDESEVERLFRQRFRRQLRHAEFDFVFAKNGIDALRILQESANQICLVLTDINMPEMDGLTLLSKLPEIDQNLKAVVVSAYGDIKNIRIAMNRGAFDFVTKPIDFEDLEITINKTLNFVKFVRSQQQKIDQAQLNLIQSEKMASLGQLMSGVAHEIKNPVNFIHNNVSPAKEYVDILSDRLQKIQEYLVDDDFGIGIPAELKWGEMEFILSDLTKILNGMETGTEMLMGISATLRNFARTDDSVPVICNLHTCLDSVLLILSHRLKARGKYKEIIIEKQYGELPQIACYPGQLNQVFMNILANSIEALEEGMSEQLISEQPKIVISTAQTSPDWIAVRIKDNGIGMPAEVQQLMFEPLFTTKPSGKGTGLGMSISRQIITERHRGKISCISQLGEGAEFIIELPQNLDSACNNE
jgi:two-component system, NtrC family, sensor kinase